MQPQVTEVSPALSSVSWSYLVVGLQCGGKVAKKKSNRVLLEQTNETKAAQMFPPPKKPNEEEGGLGAWRKFLSAPTQTHGARQGASCFTCQSLVIAFTALL